MKYNHTQIGNLMLTILIFIIVLFETIIFLTEFNISILIVMILIIFILASFSTLNVKIDKTHLKLKFGYGIYSKKFSLKEISSVKKVRNHWYYGWGIRYWPFRKMWIFNVSGLDAIEIEMKNSRIFRIGTNKPNKLLFALKKSL